MACYMIQSFLAAFIGQATLVSKDTIMGWNWWDWTIFVAIVLSPVIVTWRAFVDQSKQRQEAETKP